MDSGGQKCHCLPIPSPNTSTLIIASHYKVGYDCFLITVPSKSSYASLWKPKNCDQSSLGIEQPVVTKPFITMAIKPKHRHIMISQKEKDIELLRELMTSATSKEEAAIYQETLDQELEELEELNLATERETLKRKSSSSSSSETTTTWTGYEESDLELHVELELVSLRRT